MVFLSINKPLSCQALSLLFAAAPVARSAFLNKALQVVVSIFLSTNFHNRKLGTPQARSSMMKKAIERLEAFDKKKCVNVIVETPKGSRVKYAYMPESGLFRIKRALPEGMVFPFNFGFIPSTLGDDGDPIDILIINEEPVVSGCLLKARLLAVIKAKQIEDGETVENDRIIGEAIPEETPPEFYEAELDKRRLTQIKFFFIAYNKFGGKKFKVSGIGGSQQAEKLIHQGIKKFQKKKSK
jgi:inorganic pyrophosphatase